MKALISNIQRFSLHDGPGIRTTIFFMGCPLRCPWCCNPENLTAEIKEYYDEFGRKQTWGKEFSCEELEEQVLKDAAFYSHDGGVTYSGGECLLQLKNMLPLLRSLKQQNIHQCVETCLNVPKENLLAVLPYVNMFYIDLKMLTPKFETINGNLDLVMQNLNILKQHHAQMTFRIPIVKGITDEKENLLQIRQAIREFCPTNVEVFSVHNLGAYKYARLKMPYAEFASSSNEEIEKINEFLKK